MNHLPVGLKCYMRRPGHGMLQGITLQKGGLFSVEKNEWSEAREGIYPRHLLHYYNRYVSQIQDAAIYNPLEFIFVADGGFCQHDDLRSILTRDWTPEQLATVGEGVAAVHRAAEEAAAATVVYSSRQSVTLDAAAVMDAGAPATVAPAAPAPAPAPVAPAPAPAAATATATVVFSTTEACKKLLDSCGGFEELRPRVCAHLDPCCVQATVLDLEDEVHWIMLEGKGTAIWDELRAIQKHMRALRALCV
jgi:hypothetical protein